MEAPVPMAPVASSQKRPLEDTQPSTPNQPNTSTASTPLSILSSADTPSPMQKSAFANQPNTTTAAPAASTMAQPPAKRRKFTDQEKEAQRLEKEAKAKARAEKKEQKEAEDKLKAEQKAEEKKKKDEEKKKKDEEKKQKEEDKRRKEEEKLKKERSQLKLNAFFVKPKASADSAGKSMVDNVQGPTTDLPASLAHETGLDGTNAVPPSPQKAIQKAAKSDYDRYFLPFSPAPNTIIAPWNAYVTDADALAASRARMEKIVSREDIEMEQVTMDSYRFVFPKRRRGLDMAPISDIVELINGSADKPIDLTGTTSKPLRDPVTLLKQIPMKYLHFSEDVRPPYYGTYTKPHNINEECRLGRNPISRGLEELDYDYDSEAEWEEPEEGEDLDSDGEEDDDDGDEDLEGFLDDEEDTSIKRRLVNGDQEPASSGLCWENASGVSILNDGSGAICTEFRDFRMGFLLDPQPQAIDPFSTKYWPAAPTPVPPPVPGQPTITSAVNGLMNPPRLPLTSRPANGTLNTLNPPPGASLPSSSLVSTASKATKPKQLIPADQLPAFKAEIDGQDLTKLAMIEALKKKFPKLGKQAIVDTLGAVAKRVGSSQKEKVWVLL